MEPVTIGEILNAVKGRLLGDFSDLDATVSKVNTDSRNIHPGALFVPLIGERFDGHAFIEDALEAGAAGVFTARERDRYLPGKFYIQVSNTQRALRDLASYYRQKFKIRYIGVTGSVGKTTTKDMLAAVLGVKYKVLKTEGNFNNEVGLPLTLLKLNSSHQCAILEMGMSSLGEIDYLSKIVEPDVAVITNIGDSHIEFLGSRENIFKAKCEIFNHMRPGGLAILNGDDLLLRSLEGALSMETIWCGKGERNAYRALNIQNDGKSHTFCTIETPHMKDNVQIPALGDHMIYPVLMAAAAGEYFGMTTEEILQGISDFSPTKMRMNILHRADNITILDDVYNANPQSMRAAVEVLSQTRGKHKIAVLGDMFELGALAPALHRGIGEYLGKKEIDCLVAAGPLAKHIYDAALDAGVPQAYYCATKEEALPILERLLQKDSTFLVKASRGMAFEVLISRLKELTAPAKP
ncbi:MAG: UDP-N-acetylmuramoyl-tripeptide--D-alanyl-D-alanine ligase [Oscillospiraceae bacterium]|nr:UDP-N-acetylmuramoyl-tripeptide--D-alanyl-D-alanine ligase [Oscillospiraceae bacterium]